MSSGLLVRVVLGSAKVDGAGGETWRLWFISGVGLLLGGVRMFAAATGETVGCRRSWILRQTMVRVVKKGPRIFGLVPGGGRNISGTSGWAAGSDFNAYKGSDIDSENESSVGAGRGVLASLLRKLFWLEVGVPLGSIYMLYSN